MRLGLEMCLHVASDVVLVYYRKYLDSLFLN